MSNHLTHFEIFGEDPEKLVDFYQKVFGWEISKMEGIAYWRIGSVETAGTLHGGVSHKYLHNLGGWLMYINVESLDTTVEKIVEEGGGIVRQKTAVPRTAWMTIVSDPAGNKFGIWQADPLAMPMPEPD